ncbi:CYTH domain-containing protein [Lentisphaerota bacterium WC36G]|nr:CYTH domain-containing protein [Lentisphaerae bacterium WC36]
MAKEIEKKFLIKDDSWRNSVTKSVEIIQGYSFLDSGVFRIRIINKECALLTIKSSDKNGVRNEFEYKIPLKDANQMLEIFCQKVLIHKKRHHLFYKNHEWVIDEFLGDNAPLIVAEIELSHIDENFEKPSYLGREVSQETKYLNSNLIQNPFCKWQ